MFVALPLTGAALYQALYAVLKDEAWAELYLGRFMMTSAVLMLAVAASAAVMKTSRPVAITAVH